MVVPVLVDRVQVGRVLAGPLRVARAVVAAVRVARMVIVPLPAERERVPDEATVGRVKVGVRTGRVVMVRVAMTDVVMVRVEMIDVVMAGVVMTDGLRVGVPMGRVEPMVVVLMIVGLMNVAGIAARRDSSNARSERRRPRPSGAVRPFGRVAREKFVRVSSKPRSNANPSVGSTRVRSGRRRWPQRNEPNQHVLVEPKTFLSIQKSKRRSRPHSSRVARHVSVTVCFRPRSRSKVNVSLTLVVWPTRCSRKCPTCRPCTR